MKQKAYKKIIISVAIILAANLVLAFSSPALADETDNFWGGSQEKAYVKTNSGLPSDGGVEDPRRLVVQIIKLVLSFLGILAVIIILYAGFKWMLSGGSEEKIGEAKSMLIAGLIGLIIIVFAYIIANFVITTIVNVAT
ncbi:MAG: hypothetical protein Q7K35_03670 [bacterium]|nr:hypothetical protein [bacterium]